MFRQQADQSDLFRFEVNTQNSHHGENAKGEGPGQKTEIIIQGAPA